MTNTELKEMATRIKVRRKALKFTQEQFAEVIGISSSSYTRIENAFQKPSLDTLIKISRNLNISLDFIVFGTKESKRKSAEKAEIVDALLGFADKKKLTHAADVLDKLINVL